MKVKFLSAAGGKDMSFSAGQEADVDEALGQALVKGGLAESLEKRSALRDEVSALNEGGEKAARRSPRSKR